MLVAPGVSRFSFLDGIEKRQTEVRRQFVFLTRGVRLPCNLRLGIPKEPVDVAFSETLDTERLRYIRASLVPGGRYFFYLTGHYRDARRRLREAGFSEVRFPFLLSAFQRQKIVAGVR